MIGFLSSIYMFLFRAVKFSLIKHVDIVHKCSFIMYIIFYSFCNARTFSNINFPVCLNVKIFIEFCTLNLYQFE